MMIPISTGQRMAIVAGAAAVTSAIAFVLYALDKTAARRGARRVPENTLHLWGLLGGWPGALLAQQLFRHKTRKASFQVVFWVTVVVNCAAIGWVIARSSAVGRQSPRGSGEVEAESLPAIRPGAGRRERN